MRWHGLLSSVHPGAGPDLSKHGMDEFGNPGVSAWFDPQLPDSEYLLLTSVNSQQLENSLGASLLRREEDGEIQDKRVSGEEAAYKDFQEVHPGDNSAGGAGFSQLRTQLNGFVPRQCYNSPENRSCFDEGYPLLFYNKQDSGRFDSYQGTFRISSCYEDGHDTDCGAAKADPREMQSLTRDMDEHNFNEFDRKLSPLFEAPCVEEYEIHKEGSSGCVRENRVCNVGIPKEHEIHKECSNKNAGEDLLWDAGNTTEYGIHEECSNEKAGENRLCNAVSMKEYETEIHKEPSNENARGYHVRRAGDMDIFEIHKECSNENTGETQACNTESLLPIPTETGEGFKVAETQKEQICNGVAGKMNLVLETGRGAARHQEGEPVRQESPVETPFKPNFRKSLRRKKPSTSRKRVPRKNLTSQKRKGSVPATGDRINLLNTYASEGFVVSACPKIDIASGPICSSSVVASTGPENCGSNEEDMEHHEALEADNTGYAVSVSSSNMNIAIGIAGRITRSRALGRPCGKPVGGDALMDKSNVLFANKATGKRSVLCKTVRSTIWGGLEILKQGLEKKGRDLKSEMSCIHSETGKTDIEAEVLQNRRGRKKTSGVRGRCSIKSRDDGQSEQLKIPVPGSRRNYTKKKNDKQGKGIVQEPGFILECKEPGGQELNNQGQEISCFLGESGSVEGNTKQKGTKEEYKCLETKRDQFPIDQTTCDLSLEISNLVGKMEVEDASHRCASEQTTCASVNGTEYHVSETIKTEESVKGLDEDGQHEHMMAYEKESNVRQEEESAIAVQGMCGIAIDVRTKLPEEGISNQHVVAPGTTSKLEEDGVKVEKGLAESCNVPISWRKLRNQKRSQYHREAIGFKDGASEMNMPTLEFQEKNERKSCYAGITATEIHLNGLSELGTDMESLVNPCSNELGNKDFNDMVSVTPHADLASTVILPIVGQDLGKKKERRKGKMKGKSEPARIDLGLPEVLGESLDTLQELEATRKLRKSRVKRTEKNVGIQGRKSNLKNQRKHLHADTDNELIAIEGVPSGMADSKAIHESQELCKGKESLTLVKEEPVENASFGNAKVENTPSNGKRQAGKKLKNSRKVGRKSELMEGDAICHDIKRKPGRQKNNTCDKKLLCGKSKCARKGSQNFVKNKDQLGTVGCSQLSGNDSNFIAMAEQGKEVRELPGLKGQSDLCTFNALIGETVLSDAAISLKTPPHPVNGQQKHEFSNFIPEFHENNPLKDKILGSEVMVGCNNEVGGEDVSSGLTEVEANRSTNVTIQKCESVEGYCGPPRVGWVLCDDCHKWRCIPVELADAIEETNCRWTCQDNPSKEFADCSIPQEKSNTEINAELNISDVSCEEGDCNGVQMNSKDVALMQAPDSQQAVWTLIKHNMFLHRSRKTQVIDEIMVCHCKSPEDGGLGCGDECLNRMLSIECVQGTCPCGELCSNQQFQKRLYAEVGWFRCGKKGFGLQVLEDVPKGLFIIEYVGEVLDMQVYESRQKEYASRGQKHFYFMTLNSNEVIDACAKGNLGRFINHSCDPNCRTEKWMVNGEVCIGLFAVRDIKKGEEVTFDYNYVRVFGAAAKKCECGSAECRGFIGGDPLTPAVVAQVESDEDYPAPVMLQEESENDGVQEKKVLPSKLHAFSDNVAQEQLSFPSADLTSKCSPISSERQANASKSSTIMKKLNASPSLEKAFNVKSSTVETSGHFEGVEDKLNELLNGEGGISKRKDAAKHYLKLLLVTAASGDSVHGEASSSTRELSMVLDALLKTRSQTVLIDIMNKNGLQMLHNMMKQNRRNYNKTPIIRKLLKVLEFLATKDVLTIEHINSGPPCKGMESFKESIFALTRHSDRQVQESARCFRDNWIPRTIKMFNKRERLFSFQGGLPFNDYRKNRCKFSVKRWKCTSPRQTDAIDCTSQLQRDPEHVVQINLSGPDPYEVSHNTWDTSPNQDSNEKQNEDIPIEGQMKVIRKRKRKSRWDQPKETVVMDQHSTKMNLEGVESNMQPEKGCDPLNICYQRDNFQGREQDVHTDADGKWASEQKHMATSPAKNISNHDSSLKPGAYSHQTSEQRCTLNGSEAFVKQQSCLQFSMQQSAHVPVHIQSCMGSNHTPLSSMSVPVRPPCCSNIVYGYAVGKPQGTFLPHLPLSYGIPLPLLEQLGRSHSILQDNTAQALSPQRPHREWSNNSSSVLPDLPHQPCAGQPIVGGFSQPLHHQLGAWNVPFPMQSAVRPLLSGQQQVVEIHPGVHVGQGSSHIPDCMEPEPPVPGLSPPRSSEAPCNSNRPIRGRSKAACDQAVKLGKRHWKQHKSNFRGFSKFHGRSDRKCKDWFHQKNSLPFKGTWKGRFSTNFHRDQNIQHVLSHNILDLRKEQQKLEHMNSANFLKGSSNDNSTFHHQ